jgi:uncharacterized protein YfdQ (DUF2303 family)
MAEPNVVVQHTAEADAVAKWVSKGFEPRILSVGDASGRSAQVLLTPEKVTGFSVKKFLDEYLEAPERRKGTAHHTELASFIEHVKRFADTDSAIFAHISPEPGESPALVCVLDYHRAGPEGKPRFGEHRSVYHFPVSEEWVAWLAHNGKPMGQDGFARFIEDRLQDIANPKEPGRTGTAFAELLACEFASPTRLLELSKGLSVHVSSKVVGQVKLSSGEMQVMFSEEHSADGKGEPVKVPNAFLIGIPVFRGGELYKVPARLRYRVQSGQVTWTYDLYRPTACFDDAVNIACDKAEEETELPLFRGTPE